MYKTYGSKTYRDGRAELQLHDAVRRWSRGLVGLAAPGVHVSVETNAHPQAYALSNHRQMVTRPDLSAKDTKDEVMRGL